MELLAIYLVVINTVVFVLFGIDKSRAVHHQWRIPERTLLGLVLLGGSVGGIVGSRAFNHKTNRHRKWYFVYGMPLVALAQAAILAVLYERGVI